VRTIRIHDTRSGGLVELEPREPGKVGIYACGPTVYNRIHVGNARPFVVFSLLKRFLEHEGYEATLVINITDVNDKIYDAARSAGVSSAQLAVEMTQHYIADTDGLSLGRPDHEPLAGEMVPEMIDLISALIDRAAAYAARGDVYFRVRSDADYGSLSHRSVDAMDQGENDDPVGLRLKEDPLDFALWKAHKEGEDTSWDAPWGRGRPGWHIECSAMAESLLGLDFEIHGGGSDLVFPHHENEAAQTRMGRGAQLNRIWMHNGFIQIGEEKMAKSIGNVALLHEVLERDGAATIVMLMVGGHYRKPLSFTDETLVDAAARVRRVREAARRLVDGPSPPELAAHKERFFDALADDFNTPTAMAAAFEWIREANARHEPAGRDDLAEMLGVLGLGELVTGADDAAPDAVVALAQAREDARAARDFAEADRLRDEIAAAGWTVRDGAAGFELVPR
jgi:cysteinyl-tRNA synthetase